MRISLLILLLLFISFAGKAQFAIPNGDSVGHQLVIGIPVNDATTLNAQALVYFPDDYAANPTKKYPLIIFLHGAGQGATNNITEVTNQALPFLIKNGMRPSGID